MPLYRVWYRDREEPLEFTTASRTSEAEIVERVLAYEQTAMPAESGNSASVAELIDLHKLAPVRYTEDESEMNVIA